jgi:hypothetical protein
VLPYLSNVVAVARQNYSIGIPAERCSCIAIVALFASLVVFFLNMGKKLF